MALSRSFFTLRSGSTKSLTFSTFRGKQVTKDRVSDIKNPQSTAQMSQRLIVPLVASARAALKGLIDHSFEGTTYGWQSLQKFSSLNMQKNALSVTQYVPKGAMDCGEANFIVSRGSLPEVSIAPNTTQVNGLNDGVLFNVLGNKAYTATTSDSTPSADFIKEFCDNVLLATPATDQISFLFAEKIGTYNFTVNGTEYTAPRHQWGLYRYMKNFSDDETKPNYSYDASKGFILSYEDDTEVVIPVTATTADSSTTFALKSGSYTYTDAHGTATTYDACFKQQTENESIPITMAAVINSRLDGSTWKRSSQRCRIINGTRIAASVVLPTYLSSSSSVNSDYFLNNGDKATGIEGNSGSSSIDDSNDGGEKTQG